MSKAGNFIKEKFLSKKFLSFVIIGCINTLINTLVYKGVIIIFDFFSETDISTAETGGIIYYISMATATLLAFVIASLFSYYANAKFTYKQKKKDSRTFGEASLAFTLRFALTYLFTLLIAFLFTLIFKDNLPSWYRTLSNLIASVIMIPPFYLALGWVFKRTKKRLEDKNETTEETKN